jgi:fimbrial isopeptide formation D2 family protein/LPXTG-motif cell wall-anchored protein
MKFKNFKKLLCVIMALVLSLSMGSMVFAANDSSSTTTTGTLNIQSKETGREYNVYQIFTGDVNDKTLTNIEWGSAMKGTGYDYTSDLVTALGADATIGAKFAGLGDNPTAAAVAGCMESEFFTKNAENADILASVVGSVIDAKGSPKAAESPTATGTEAPYNYSITGLKTGYYMIDENVLTGKNAKETYTRWIMAIAGVQNITSKTSTRPKLEKDIISRTTTAGDTLDPDHKRYTDAAIGETLTFKLTSNIPQMAGYRHYQYVIHDKMSTGLTFEDGSVEVKVNDVVVDSSKYIVTFENQELKIVFKDFLDNYKDLAGKDLTVTYKATLNDTAYSTAIRENNQAYLVYSNDPTATRTTDPDDPDNPDDDTPKDYVPVTGETPKQEVYAYATSLKVHKKDENGFALSGAEFTLTGKVKTGSGEDAKEVSVISNVRIDKTVTYEESSNGTFYKLATGTYTTVAPATDGSTDKYYDSTTTKYVRNVKETKVLVSKNEDIIGTVDEGGWITFTGLAEGEYTLTETKKPDASYNDLEPINFKITMNGNPDDGITWGVARETTTDLVTFAESSDKQYITAEVINTKGSQLPDTGGMGTTVFYVVGAMLVLVAAVLLVTRRRMREER